MRHALGWRMKVAVGLATGLALATAGCGEGLLQAPGGAPPIDLRLDGGHDRGPGDGLDAAEVAEAGGPRADGGAMDRGVRPQPDTALDDLGRPGDRGPTEDQALPEDMSPPAPDRGPPAGEALSDRLEVTDIEAPAGVQGGATSWRIWGRGSLGVAPVFTVPLPDCSTLVGYTSRAPEGLVAWALHLDAADRLIAAHRLADGLALRGLAAEPDGHFGALLWDDAGDAIHVRRFSPDGQALWSTELRNPDNRPDDFDIGDSRLAFGDGRYGAYYHVHSNTGHEGDTLKWVTTEGAERTGWGWGCSHSMSTVLRFHGELGQFLPVCVTDCFPGTNGDFGAQSQGGVYLNHRGPKVIDVDAGCNGSVAGEIGSLAPAAGGWALTFNAHQAPLTQGQRGYQGKNQDVGFVRIQGNNQVGAVVWLTTTPEDEADVSVARWGAAEFVVGWTVGGQGHRLARVDDAGRILEGPVDVSATARWGKRDDPFRQHVNGDVIWAWFDRGGDTALHIGRVRSGDACR